MRKEKIIFALGFFDGVHLGHQALLRACRELAREENARAGVLTFDTHPAGRILGQAPLLINSLEDRKVLLKDYGMEPILALPFSQALMRTPWSVFLSELVDRGAAGFVCGSDFRFGAGGQGTAEKLAAFCKSRELACAVVPEQLLDGIRISSTHIRTLLEAGEPAQARRFLGHPHRLTGEVVSGQQLGRTMGVPTANVRLPEKVLLPRFGVYVCQAAVDGKVFPAVTNVGSRPTVEGRDVTVEPWLLGFEGDLYGRSLTLSFYEFLRPERKFSSLEALKDQIRADARATEAYFDRAKGNPWEETEEKSGIFVKKP